MKLLQSLALLAFFVGCHSSGTNNDVPCTCGQPTADIEGCAHEKCMHGERNPDNPDCVCGSLTIPK